MTTVQDRINNWKLSELRGASQVNDKVLLAWYNKGFQIFQKELLEYVANNMQVSDVTADLIEGQDLYDFPFGQTNIKDFYSITQLRVAYKKDKEGNPIYRVVKPINLTDYNIDPQTGRQHGEPHTWGKVSTLRPRYSFVGGDKFKLYPTPKETIRNGIKLDFNYFIGEVLPNTNIEALGTPYYFLDAIDDYLTFRLYQAENPELAQNYYQQFIKTLQDNIYGLNRDKRPIDENFANLSYFYIR